MEINNNATQDFESQDFLNFKDLFYQCLSKWYWFVLSLAVCLGVAVFYILRTPPVYTRSASILLKDDSRGASTSAENAFSDLGMFTTKTNVNDEMGTLRSPDIMREVVLRLGLNIDYSADGRFHRLTVYGNQLPVAVSFLGLSDSEYAKFTLNLSEDGTVSLSDFVLRGVELTDGDVKGKLNDTIQSPVGNLLVAPSPFYIEGKSTTLQVVHSSVSGVAAGYSARLIVSKADEKANIISLSISDVSTKRADDVLNTLIAVYNENWVKDKNQIAVSTSMFINERLGVIERELGNVDSDISSYKSENLLPDVQAAASIYMSQVSEANATIKELNDKVYMAKYIRDYLTNKDNKFQLLPANSGIDNQGITTQITEYNQKLMERNSLVAHSSTKNPLVESMDESLAALRSALVRSIDNQLVALNEQIKSQQGYMGQATSQIASNPKQAKYLLSVERQQKVKESLYLYLLQKREENELSQAFTAYNTRIITMPHGSMIPTAPMKRNILMMALALGLMIPGGLIFLLEMMNTVVRGRKDLDELTVPFAGEIPFAGKNKPHRKIKDENYARPIVVQERSRDVVNEAFRVVRTNLEFMLGKDSKVIMITSANVGSGKTFIAYNLATSLVIKGKKVAIMDLDLRKGSLSHYVGKAKTGIADYLAERVDKTSDIVYDAPNSENLKVIPVGTIPPNPTELLFSERLAALMDTLKKSYDYVIVDCPPVEIVADAAIINKLVDQTLFVIRAGLLERAMLPEIEKFYTEKKYTNMAVLLNGTDGGTGRYGYKYGYKYGYNYGYGSYYGKEDKKA